VWKYVLHEQHYGFWPPKVVHLLKHQAPYFFFTMWTLCTNQICKKFNINLLHMKINIVSTWRIQVICLCERKCLWCDGWKGMNLSLAWFKCNASHTINACRAQTYGWNKKLKVEKNLIHETFWFIKSQNPNIIIYSKFKTKNYYY